MKCMKCGRKAYKSTTTGAIETGFRLLVIRNILCYKCDEIFFAGDVVEKIERITDMVKDFIQEVTIIDYERTA